MSYEAYQAYCDQWGLDPKYTDSSKNYIVYSRVQSAFSVSAQLAAVEYRGNNVKLYIWDGSEYAAPIHKGYAFIVPTDSDVESIEIQQVYTENEYEELVENDGEEEMVAGKCRAGRKTTGSEYWSGVICVIL